VTGALWKIALVAAGFLAVVSAITAGPMETGSLDRPILRAEAETLLGQAVRLAQAGNYAELCETVAASHRMCRGQIDSARGAGWIPGQGHPEVRSATFREGRGGIRPMLVLEVAGTRADGSLYRSDFAVIRTETTRLGSLTAVYWSDVRVDPASPCEAGSSPCAKADTTPN
jgi:hypothetical protein